MQSLQTWPPCGSDRARRVEIHVDAARERQRPVYQLRRKSHEALGSFDHVALKEIKERPDHRILRLRTAS
jgi:hypothetical protein